jgi:hypothetical protein
MKTAPAGALTPVPRGLTRTPWKGRWLAVTSVSACLPPLSDPEFRGRLADIRELLHDLEFRCPRSQRAAVADLLDFIEDDLASLGWELPPPPPLSPRDREVLAAAGAL